MGVEYGADLCFGVAWFSLRRDRGMDVWFHLRVLLTCFIAWY